ncbi:MAG: phosphoadenosine phosphosulfate reductase family protein [Armatimonadota bacterium]
MSHDSSSTDSSTPRHILSLSGGKDSTALALYMREHIADIEYVFCDTGDELRETYDYLLKIEAVLGKPITRLNPDRPFSHHLLIYRGVLPDPRTRWCTKMLKLRPFEQYVGDAAVHLYVGIRADERHRKGYLSTKPNIVSHFPFIEAGITRADVLRILEESGLGLPDYYRWRSRSGCYFCFFQQRREWVGLLEEHPDLFRLAMQYEKKNVDGERYTWVQGESLEELSRPQRVAEIKAGFERRSNAGGGFRGGRPLGEVLDTEDGGEERGCLICTL